VSQVACRRPRGNEPRLEPYRGFGLQEAQRRPLRRGS
jgi:hypothetical protein